MSDPVDRLHVEMSGNTVVVSGELDAHSAGQLSAALEPRLADTVLLDLRGVTFVDSRGLSVLLSAHEGATASGGSIEIRPSTQVRRLFGLAGLDGYLHVQEG